MSNIFTDTHNREVRYLRISVTDRCNLSCMYCVDENLYIPHDSILRFEEIERCIKVAHSHGIDKIRFTGGEPFVRKGFAEFMQKTCDTYPELDVRITTNGVLLKPYLQAIKNSNVKINLSLDTFDSAKAKEISGRDFLSQILENMYALIDLKVPLKINAVAMKNINSNEMEKFVDLARNNVLDVRFIEFMPMGVDTIWEQKLYWPALEIMEEARKFATLHAISKDKTAHTVDTHGPAQMYSIENGLGRFGIITPMSSHFCHSCNRLRITSDGKLRTCLFDDSEFDLVPILRDNTKNDKDLSSFIANATKEKKIGAELLALRKKAVAGKRMVTIGG